MSLDSTLNTALSQPVATISTAVEIVHTEGMIRLLDGLGTLTFDSKTFVGHDDDFGSLSSLEAVTEQSGDQAPRLKLAIQPVNAAAGVSLAVPEAQGAPVTVWVGAVDTSDMSVLGEPWCVFAGVLDVATIVLDGNRSAVNLDVVSGFDWFFADDEGALLGDSFHESVWPGELGFKYMSDITLTMPWGNDGPRPQVIFRP